MFRLACMHLSGDGTSVDPRVAEAWLLKSANAGNARAWTKSYNVVMGLINNPRTPQSVSMNFISRLTNRDLKQLIKNREVPELIRRSADRGVVLYADITFALELAENAVLDQDGQGSRIAAELFEQHYETARHWAIQHRDQQLLNQSFVLKHFMTELAAADEAGLLDDDDGRSLAREVAYRRYMRRHHAQ